MTLTLQKPETPALPIRPFRHVLVFRYRGRAWKALWFNTRDPAILRQAVAQPALPEPRQAGQEGAPKLTADPGEDFEIVWSVARGPIPPVVRRILAAGAEIMRVWGWPRRLELDKVIQP